MHHRDAAELPARGGNASDALISLVLVFDGRTRAGDGERAGDPARIVVDDKMRSVDDEAIFVVGECARHRGEVYGVVGPHWEQASVLADVVTGADPHASTTVPGWPPSSRWPASTSRRWA